MNSRRRVASDRGPTSGQPLGGTDAEMQQTTAIKHGPVAQLGARLNGIEKVRGSSPLRSTILLLNAGYCR
jgi:hypothetical protein